MKHSNKYQKVAGTFTGLTMETVNAWVNALKEQGNKKGIESYKACVKKLLSYTHGVISDDIINQYYEYRLESGIKPPTATRDRSAARNFITWLDSIANPTTEESAQYEEPTPKAESDIWEVEYEIVDEEPTPGAPLGLPFVDAEGAIPHMTDEELAQFVQLHLTGMVSDYIRTNGLNGLMQALGQC